MKRQRYVFFGESSKFFANFHRDSRLLPYPRRGKDTGDTWEELATHLGLTWDSRRTQNEVRTNSERSQIHFFILFGMIYVEVISVVLLGRNDGAKVEKRKQSAKFFLLFFAKSTYCCSALAIRQRVLGQSFSVFYL